MLMILNYKSWSKLELNNKLFKYSISCKLESNLQTILKKMCSYNCWLDKNVILINQTKKYPDHMTCWVLLNEGKHDSVHWSYPNAFCRSVILILTLKVRDIGLMTNLMFKVLFIKNYLEAFQQFLKYIL